MSDAARGAWYRTLSAMTALVELMDRELQRDCGMPLAFYDILVEIAQAPGQAMRMSELADRVLLSRSWITRRVQALEDAGLLTRTPAEDDQRGVIATLTPEGREAFTRMERSHAESIRRHFSAHLDGADAELIAARFAAIAARARAALLDTRR